MPMRRAVRMTRQAISPRLAIRIFSNMPFRFCRWLLTALSSRRILAADPPQVVDIKRQLFAEPERVFRMIDGIVARLGVDEHGQAAMVKRQPWHDAGEGIGAESHLIHGLGMRPDGIVAPAAEPHLEASSDGGAQIRRRSTALGVVVIDMGMIAGDPLGVVHEHLPRSALRLAEESHGIG